MLMNTWFNSNALSPAKGLAPFDPGLDPGEEWAKGGVRLRGPSPWSGEGPERQTERSVWLRQRNAKDPKGKPSVPPGFASGTRKTRKANRAFRLASPAEREREAPPRSGDKALPPCATCAAEGRIIRSRNWGDKAFRIHHGERGKHGEKREARNEDRHRLRPWRGRPRPRAPKADPADLNVPPSHCRTRWDGHLGSAPSAFDTTSLSFHAVNNQCTGWSHLLLGVARCPAAQEG